MESCRGPCLEHCYKRISLSSVLFYIIIGLLFGIIIMYFKNKKSIKHNNCNHPKMINIRRYN